MKTLAETKNSASFELVSIDDRATIATPAAPARTSSETITAAPPKEKKDFFHISPRGRLVALAGYLLINGLSSLYFCLVQAGMESIEICYSFGSCLFYSTQGWPALGQQSIDLVVMSYISGTVSLLGGTLGAFGMYAAYKESSSKVRLFARAWWMMLGIIIGSTVLTLFLTVIHKERFLNQCGAEHDAVFGTAECGSMYVGALVGSLIGCLIGVTMIWCYGEDVANYSIQLDVVKDKTRRIEESP
ncbi:hypothetical protein BGZ67_008046 [Mortierella alpina]|nr:hypothetical protein BGZ67_008046 [Mortierella alpina]